MRNERSYTKRATDTKNIWDTVITHQGKFLENKQKYHVESAQTTYKTCTYKIHQFLTESTQKRLSDKSPIERSDASSS